MSDSKEVQKLRLKILNLLKEHMENTNEIVTKLNFKAHVIRIKNSPENFMVNYNLVSIKTENKHR